LVFQKSCHIFASAFALKTAGSTSEGSKKYFEKSYQKIWYIQNKYLSLHPISALKKR
jgi:hypothetical protein